MSWDVILFNSSEKITDPAELNEDKLLPVSFTTVFKNHFTHIVKDGNHREIKGEDYAIDYFYSDEPSTTMMLSLYGEDAIYALIDLAIKNNWQIFDTGNGEMIDLANPANNGYEDFQAFRSQVLNQPPPKKQNWFNKLFNRK